MDTPRRLRERRLLRRHLRAGRTEAEARAFINASERPNARRIERSRARCTRVVLPGQPEPTDTPER